MLATVINPKDTPEEIARRLITVSKDESVGPFPVCEFDGIILVGEHVDEFRARLADLIREVRK